MSISNNYAEIDLNTLLVNIRAFSYSKFENFFYSIESNDLDKYYQQLIGNKEISLFRNLIKLESLLIHEKTHYLDFSCTYYGIEYGLWKHRLAKLMLKEENLEEVRGTREYELFSSLISEMQPLAETKNIDSIQELEDGFNYNFGTTFNEKFGFYIIFIITDNNGNKIEVPLSLIALIEARATANEYLNYFRRLELINDSELLNNELEKFNALLNDTHYIEYNILLKFLIYDFAKNGINTLESLQFFVALSGYILDCDFIQLSILTNSIKHLFKKPFNNSTAGLIKELYRGFSNRQVFVFMISQFVTNYVRDCEESQRISFINKIRNYPLDAVYQILKILGINESYYKDLNKYCGQATLNLLLQHEGLKTKELYRYVEENSSKMITNSYQVNLFDYYFLDDFRELDDDNDICYVKYNRRINVDIWNLLLGEYNIFYQISKNDSLYKFAKKEISFPSVIDLLLIGKNIWW